MLWLGHGAQWRARGGATAAAETVPLVDALDEATAAADTTPLADAFEDATATAETTPLAHALAMLLCAYLTALSITSAAIALLGTKMSLTFCAREASSRVLSAVDVACAPAALSVAVAAALDVEPAEAASALASASTRTRCSRSAFDIRV